MHARKYLFEHSSRQITIKNLRNHLNEIAELDELSLSGARHLLKNILKYSYKVAHKVPSKMIQELKKKEFCEAAYIQYFLQTEGYSLIYLDEFNVSMRNSKIYNWSQRGEPTSITINYDSWKMNFVIAFSERGIEGVKAWTGSIDSMVFCWFIEDVWNRMISKENGIKNPVIILDNASLHTWRDSAELMKKSKIKCISITPYSPQLNAAEKMITIIKNKIRKEWIKNKPMSIRLFKTIVDEINENSWKRWIIFSRLEVFNKIKSFIIHK